MIYDEAELKKSIEAGERRLAALKQAARKRKRWQMGSFIALAITLPLVVAAFIASRRVPDTPHFVVTWPKTKTRQSIASGQTVLAREGQPFEVSLSEATKWNVTWITSGLEQSGESIPWGPQKGGELLRARCRAKNTDWTAYFSSVVPSRDLSLGSVAPDLNAGYRRSVSLPSGSAWVFPHVQAIGNVGWDERALPALSLATDVIPGAVLDQKLEAVTEKPARALWQLVSDFEGTVRTPALDGSTYAALHSSNLDTVLPQVGARLVQVVPEASIKWILRLDKGAPEGIVRLSFDGKRERRAWVKEKGGAAGKPITGWENGEWKNTIPMTVPTVQASTGPTPTGATPAPTGEASATPSPTGKATSSPIATGQASSSATPTRQTPTATAQASASPSPTRQTPTRTPTASSP